MFYVEELIEGMLFGDVEDDFVSISLEFLFFEFYSNFRLEIRNVVVWFVCSVNGLYDYLYDLFFIVNCSCDIKWNKKSLYEFFE